MPTTPSRGGGGYSADTLYFTTEFSGDTGLNAGRIYLGGTLVGKPSVWEELPEPSPYQMVDLGLTSGLKWADRNVGAASPEAYGDYFAWGETAPRGENWATEAPYDWAHAPFNNGSEEFDEAYFSANSGTWLTEDGTLKSDYDAAHAIMGGSWRMPTSAEMQELLDGTTRKFEILGGIRGLRFTAPNGNSIFMPFAGLRNSSGAYIVGTGTNGYVLSSSLDAGDANYSRSLSFDIFGGALVDNYIRYDGFAVRGVC